jgi:hypothetical protein
VYHLTSRVLEQDLTMSFLRAADLCWSAERALVSRHVEPRRNYVKRKARNSKLFHFRHLTLSAHTHTHEGGNLTGSAICHTFIIRGITQYPRTPTTSEIHPPEFRDAANKSEYRLIWLSASQFLPSRLPVPSPALACLPACPLPPSPGRVPADRRGHRAKFVSLVRALAF